MKYFTSEWWQNGSENATEIFKQYSAYFSSIKSKLPTSLVSFDAEHTLHDAEVKRIDSDFSKRKVVMEFSGWDINFSRRVRYTISFSDVSLFEQQFPQQEYVEEELGDLGYWECEFLDSDIEIRMLFVSTAEFRIVFKGFEFKYEPAQA